jgi:hypothetical protein
VQKKLARTVPALYWSFLPDAAHILSNTSKALFNLILSRGAKVMTAKRRTVELAHERFSHLFSEGSSKHKKKKSKKKTGERWEEASKKRKAVPVSDA